MSSLPSRHLAAPGLAALAIGVTLACAAPEGAAPGASATAEDGSAVVATIDGQPITLDELDGWIKDELFRRNTQNGAPEQVHQLREQAINRMIDRKLVDTLAAKRGLSAETLLQEETAELEPITEEEVAAFFETHKAQMGGRTLEDVEPMIRQRIEQEKRSNAVVAYLAVLREGRDVNISLERPRVEIEAVGPSRGPSNAPVTIVEFSDYQCPFCKRAETVVRDVLERYPEQVRYVYRHFPLTQIHPQARPASEAAACAGDQDRFWEYHDAVFALSPDLTREKLLEAAGSVALDLEAFQACLDEGRARDRVDQDLAAGRAAGVSGTPAFFVNGVMLSGARSVDDFVKIIEGELAVGG